MYTILIAGAGQLGGRHLQGVKTSSLELDIWVFDLSLESLQAAENRYNQVESPTEKRVHFVQSIDLVPSVIDVAIVASSSLPRYAIVTEMLSKRSVRYLILEKFLFPRLSDYDEIASLLKEKCVETYVNCPRRMFECYDIIKEHIDRSSPIYMSKGGKDWGLCCNSIHYIDIFMWLAEEKDYTINITELIPEVVDSKRIGYVELNGTEIINTSNGSQLTLTSTTDYTGSTDVVIRNGLNGILLNEITGDITINGTLYKSSVKYQSSLSGMLVDDLLKEGACRLTPYEESARYHKEYLATVAPFINKIKGWTTDSCPIT